MSVIFCVYVVWPRDIIKIRMKLVILHFVYTILKMRELQNKTVTMELNNLQLETIKCLFGHNDWEMKIIEQAAVVEENGGNSHVQNNNDQSTQTNNDNVANEADEDDNPEFVIPPDTLQEECQYCFCSPCITNEQNKQMWWHDRAESPHQRNAALRKEH